MFYYNSLYYRGLPVDIHGAPQAAQGIVPRHIIYQIPSDPDKTERDTTVVHATYDVGWGHQLWIRGDTPPLSWSQGIQMQWTAGNIWTWQTDSFPAGATVEFKVLIDDTKWEIVDGQATKNHTVTSGTTADISPVFP